MASADPFLNLHLEPERPVEISALVGALGALSRQYQDVIQREGIFDKPAEARLVIANVKPGSIDINFLIELTSLGTSALPVMLPLLIDKAELLEKFARRLKAILDFFLEEKSAPTSAPPSDISIRDCDDAVNIVKPIATSGGTQNITVVKGDLNVNILSVTKAQALKITESAVHTKALLGAQVGEVKQRVSLTWVQLATDAAKTTGIRSPDKGVIAEIDASPHAVLFTDEMAPIKREMIDDEVNPYKKVYFVDVEISRVPDGRITAYRIIGFFGKEDI